MDMLPVDRHHQQQAAATVHCTQHGSQSIMMSVFVLSLRATMLGTGACGAEAELHLQIPGRIHTPEASGMQS